MARLISPQPGMIISGSGHELERVVIVDGYVDEPTCLGVPPYVSPYPRYIAGAIWSADPHAEVIYQTIDSIRETPSLCSVWSRADAVLLIAGMIVPGKYVGGTPISVNEARRLFSDPQLQDTPKLLVGPWARFGCGLEGGRLALSADALVPPFDYIVPGDPELVLSDIASGESIDHVDLARVRHEYSEIEDFIVRGTRIVTQHPNYPRGYLICEIETYRGCPRTIIGGCSFCTEPLYGFPVQRAVSDVVREIEALYEAGVRAFRIGNQADLFTYGSPEMGDEEFPTPAPEKVEELFSKARRVAPKPAVLHIDNVNPGTLAHHPHESELVAKSIIKYHTTGDVAAFGVESVDPEVIKRNNLKASEDEVIDAIRLLNRVGGKRPSWGLPHLLPGINLLYGLAGESRRTLDLNLAFLQSVYDEGLMVRRINIRQVIGFPGTRMATAASHKIKHHEFFRHKQLIRDTIDTQMLKRVAPLGTVLNSVFLERAEGRNYLLRPLGTYPPLCYMPPGPAPADGIDVFVIGHGPRSLSVLPFPFDPNRATLARWSHIPGIGKRRAARAKSGPFATVQDLESALDLQLPDWLKHALVFKTSPDGGPGRI